MRRPALFIGLFVLFLTLACFAPIEPRPDLKFDPARLPAAQIGVQYEATITVTLNVTPVFRISVAAGNLPNGLKLEYHANDTFAKITGTPTQAGTFQFKVLAMCLGTNVNGQSGEMEYIIEVK